MDAPSKNRGGETGGGSDNGSWSAKIGRWSLRLRVFLFFAFLAAASVAGVIGATWLSASRFDPAEPDAAFALAAIVSSFTILGVTTWVWFLFDENVAKPLVAIASELRSRAHADVREGLDDALAQYLGDLAPAAAAVSTHLAESRADLDAAIDRERARILAEQARLDAILRDAPIGCLLCNDDHRIVLYNRQAVDQLGEIGLDRRLFEALREEPIQDALQRLRNRDDDAATDLLCTTRDGQHTFHARMRLFSDDQGAADGGGYLVTFRDVTEDLRAHAGRELLLRDIFDGLQRPAANLLSSIEALRTPEGAEPSARARLQAAVVAETRDLAETITTLRQRYANSDARWWPMVDAPASDVLRSAEARLAAEDIDVMVDVDVAIDAAPLTLRCDGFAIARLIGDLATAVSKTGETSDLRLTAALDEMGEAMVDICWRGPVFPIARLEALLDAPLSAGYDGFSVRDCLRSHAADIWPERMPGGRARLRLPLKPVDGGPETAAPPRSVFHDLRLLARRDGRSDALLSALDYVVFDTETTGLEPHKGDEIVQIGAVRIVSNRLLLDERFDTLVDPERPIPAASTAIHGITDEMVCDAPSIAIAGRKFHQFCGDSLLIAHNAPFDLAFLHRHAARIEARFDHIVLDTVLMSAILFGRGAPHDLDAIAARLEVTLPDQVRHTALGDAQATAAVAQKMLAMLAGRGVDTLGAFRKAAAAHDGLLARGAPGRSHYS